MNPEHPPASGGDRPSRAEGDRPDKPKFRARLERWTGNGCVVFCVGWVLFTLYQMGYLALHGEEVVAQITDYRYRALKGTDSHLYTVSLGARTRTVDLPRSTGQEIGDSMTVLTDPGGRFDPILGTSDDPWFVLVWNNCNRFYVTVGTLGVVVGVLVGLHSLAKKVVGDRASPESDPS